MRCRFWTPEEVSKAKELLSGGKGWVQIGAELNRSPDSVRCKFKDAGSSNPAGSDPRASAVYELGGIDRLPVGLTAPATDTKPIPEPAPAVHTSKSRAEAYLLISDLQIPYHHPNALDFCKRVRFEFGVPLENVLCVGDELDNYWASRFEKSVQNPHTAEQEIAESRIELQRWATAFPHMRLCYSNHGNRPIAKAARDGFPRSVLKDFRDVLGTPATWHWAHYWTIPASKHRFRLEHGHAGPGGHGGLKGRPVNRGISTAWGHEHSEPATIHVNTFGGQQVWGMRCGSLITTEPVPAFDYNAEAASRPVGSVGVVLDGGRTPLIVRM